MALEGPGEIWRLSQLLTSGGALIAGETLGSGRACMMGMEDKPLTRDRLGLER